MPFIGARRLGPFSLSLSHFNQHYGLLLFPKGWTFFPFQIPFFALLHTGFKTFFEATMNQLEMSDWTQQAPHKNVSRCLNTKQKYFFRVLADIQIAVSHIIFHSMRKNLKNVSKIFGFIEKLRHIMLHNEIKKNFISYILKILFHKNSNLGKLKIVNTL